MWGSIGGFSYLKVGILSNFLQYVRYSENLLFGIASSRKFAISVQKELENFLKSNLHLRVNKYCIVHRDQSPISFLGHTIQLVYFYPKMRTKSKLLEATYRYKNKVLQKLRLERYKVSRLQTNKFKKIVLKHIEVMLNELGLKGKKKSDVLASLFSYKLLGDALAQSANFNNLRELIQFLWHVPCSVLYSTPKKSLSLLSFYPSQNRNRIAITSALQMYTMRSFKDFHIQKVFGMLQKIRRILLSKVRSSTELTIFECVEIKSKQIVTTYIHHLLRNKLSKMVSPLLKKEEVCQLLAGGLID